MSFDPQSVSAAAFAKAAAMPAPDSKFLNDTLSQFPSPGSLFVNPVAAPMSQLNNLLTPPPSIDASTFSSAFSSIDAATMQASSDAYAALQSQFAALASKANDFTSVMAHMTTSTYPPSMSIPSSLGGVTGGVTLPNISQTMSAIQGEQALNQQRGTTDPTNACSSLIGSISSLGSGVSSSISNLLNSTHGTTIQTGISSLTNGVNSAISQGPSLTAAVDSAKSALAAAQSQGAAAIAAAQAALTSAQNSLNSAVGGITSTISGVQSQVTDALAAVHSTIDSAMASVSSFAQSVETSVANQIHAATALMMRNLSEQSPCMSNMIHNSGLVSPGLSSLISSSPSASQQAAAAQAVKSPPASPATDVQSDAMQTTAAQKSALQTAQDLLNSEVTKQLAAANTAVTSFNSWMTSVNYQTIKNNQTQSADALAQYQALKAQAQNNTDYKTQEALSSIIKQNQATMVFINSCLNASTQSNSPSDNVWLYKEAVTVNGTTYYKYVSFTSAASINASAPGTYVPS
jgi:hypothetical protein